MVEPITENPPVPESFDDPSNYDNNFHDFKPQEFDSSTFKQRNDPQKLLYRFKLKLMNAYEVKQEKEDPATGRLIVKTVIKTKKNSKPRLNKQGIEDIMSYLETLCNGHTVQGNLENIGQFNNTMRHIANDVTCHFIAKRTDWECSLSDIDILISNAVNLLDLFLTRTLNNEERIGYGQSYKETTSREIKPENKENVFQKVGGFLSGKGWG